MQYVCRIECKTSYCSNSFNKQEPRPSYFHCAYRHEIIIVSSVDHDNNGTAELVAQCVPASLSTYRQNPTFFIVMLVRQRHKFLGVWENILTIIHIKLVTPKLNAIAYNASSAPLKHANVAFGSTLV